jgi:hypothetical protein
MLSEVEFAFPFSGGLIGDLTNASGGGKLDSRVSGPGKAAGEDTEGPRGATALACWCCIVEPLLKISKLDDVTELPGGGGSMSGRGDGGAGHLP